MSVKQSFEDKHVNEMKSGHPINYLFRRELYGTKGSPRNNVIDWRLDRSYNLYRKNLSSHFGCVNAIEFSKDGTQLASGGDDRRILLWNVEKVLSGNDTPVIMQAEHLSNIFCLSFDNCNTKIFSAGNDDFVIIHDIATGAPLDYFMHEQPVFGIAVNPLNDNIFTSACDDGRILLFDIREPSSSDPFCLAKVNSAFHSVMFNPVEPRLITSANSKEGVSLWDIRTPKKPLMKYGGQNTDQCSMSARFNSDGSQILALRRRLPPVLYSTHSTSHLFQFNHKGYYNSCTMKSCCFAGSDDQYILSGSDNFDLFMWKIPPNDSSRWVDKAHMVLKGHRSIVNQVRYNKIHPLIASSGVEKLVKLWSPFPIASKPGASGLSTITYEKERQIYTHDEYINLIMQSGQFMSLTFDTTAGKHTKEDPRMMAFFDALVQRDINGLSDESEDCSRGTSYTNLIFRPFNSASSSEITEDEEDSQLNSSQSPGQANSLNSSTAADSQNLDADSDNGFESSQNNESGEPSRSLRDGPNTMRAAWILNAVVREQNQLANSMGRNEFSDSSESESEINNSSTSQKLLNRNDREETENMNCKSSKIAEENMLTKLIVQRENHLRRLARFQVLLECKSKSRKKAASQNRYSSSESLSSATVGKKSKDSKKYFPSKSVSRENVHSSRSDESASESSGKHCDNNNSSMGKSKYFYRRKYSSSPPPKKSKSKQKKRGLSKTLQYNDYKSGGEKSSACNYWKTKSAICNSSTFDVHKPSANSKTVGEGSSTVVSNSTSSSSTSTSSETDSSDSEKKNTKSAGRKRKLETFISKKKVVKESSSSTSESSFSDSSSTSSSSSESDANDGGKEKFSKKSLALKFSPLLRRIKMEQRRRRQKSKSIRIKVVDLKQESSASTEVSASSQSQSNKSSDEGLLAKKKKLSARKKETKNSKGKVASIMKALTKNAVVTTDSGIEIEKTAITDEQQPCCSKSLNNTSKATARNEKTENQCESNSSDDNANTVAFRKRVPNCKRHYRRTKNSSD